VACGLLKIDQTLKPITKLAAGAVQTAANRAHGDVQDDTDLLVTAAIEIFQHDDRAVIGAQLVEGLRDQLLALGPLKRRGRIRVGGFVGRIFTSTHRSFTVVPEH